MEAAHVGEHMPEAVAHALLLQVVNVEMEPVLKSVAGQLDDPGLGWLDLQVGDEVCCAFERINDRVLKSRLMIPQHARSFNAAAP